MIDGGQTPDLLLDLTRGGVNSEVVKSLREVAVILFSNVKLNTVQSNLLTY